MMSSIGSEMRRKNALVLFEVMLSVLVLVVLSTYVFRGYGRFTAAVKKSARYMELLPIAEERLWQLSRQESARQLRSDTDRYGLTPGDGHAWALDIEESGTRALCQLRLTLREAKHDTGAFDVVRFFTVEDTN